MPREFYKELHRSYGGAGRHQTPRFHWWHCASRRAIGVFATQKSTRASSSMTTPTRSFAALSKVAVAPRAANAN
eukprot:12923861-Prorocentrum_lima.AAC.1